MGVEDFTDVLAHELHHFIFYRLALGLCGELFHVAGVLALLFVVAFVAALAALLIAGEQTVYHGVGIAADG